MSSSVLAGPAPRPKSLALTVLVDWSNQEHAGVKSTCHPCCTSKYFPLSPLIFFCRAVRTFWYSSVFVVGHDFILLCERSASF